LAGILAETYALLVQALHKMNARKLSSSCHNYEWRWCATHSVNFHSRFPDFIIPEAESISGSDMVKVSLGHEMN
jgi:hypothetical protein